MAVERNTASDVRITDLLNRARQEPVILQTGENDKSVLLPLDDEVLDLLLERSPDFIIECRRIAERMKQGDYLTHEQVMQALEDDPEWGKVVAPRSRIWQPESTVAPKESKVISYTDTIAQVTPERLHGFFVGWPNPPTPETHLRLLAGSDAIVLAIDETTSNVIGFITAITDGVLTAYIPHLEVLPPYQGRGIGRELVRRIVEKLSGLYGIDLLCDPPLQAFYLRCGMQPAVGMCIRNYERQSGV